MLPRKKFENLHAVMAVLVFFFTKRQSQKGGGHGTMPP